MTLENCSLPIVHTSESEGKTIYAGANAALAKGHEGRGTKS